MEQDPEAVWSANDEALTLIGKMRKKAIKEALAETKEIYESARRGGEDAPSSVEAKQTGGGGSRLGVEEQSASAAAATKEGVTASADAALQSEGQVSAAADAVLVHEDSPVDYSGWDKQQWIDASNDLNQSVINATNDAALSDIEAGCGEFLDALKNNGRGNSARIILATMKQRREDLSR
jgi:hypothetical protein